MVGHELGFQSRTQSIAPGPIRFSAVLGEVLQPEFHRGNPPVRRAKPRENFHVGSGMFQQTVLESPINTAFVFSPWLGFERSVGACRFVGRCLRRMFMSRLKPNPSGLRRAGNCWSSVLCFMGLLTACGVMEAAGTERPAPGADGNWWSLMPVSRPAVPQVSGGRGRVYNPIDSFVLSVLEKNGLAQSLEADRRTLIRRLSFDLIGLPPKPGDIEAFLSDEDPRAYERLVDRLLAMPQYGERWGRHWLDVVHYGETHGYDKDQPRPNAWPYRDYVIRAFNQDKPYGRFLQEQIAGDRLFPGTRDGFEALGFIAAGPWDLIGHAEVPESKLDGKVARHLDRDDMVTTTIQTFNSLTVQCAQCHNHKFDPISQEEYYSLQAVFAAVDRADQLYDLDSSVAETRRTIQARLDSLAARRKAVDDALASRAGQALVDLDQKISSISKATPSDAMGYHSEIEPRADVVKWVQVDLGVEQSLHRIILNPCKDNFNGIGDGFGFPVRYKVELSNDPDFRLPGVWITDRTAQDVANPKIQPQSLEVGGRAGRYIRVTATRLAPRQNDYIFALAELAAVGVDGKNLAASAAVTALDSIEAPVRWRKSNLTDGWYPGFGAPGGLELAPLAAQRTNLLARTMTEDDRRVSKELEQETASANQSLAQLPPPRKAYIGAVHKGGGAFTGTGARGGKPRPIRILARGHIQSQGMEVGPATLSCLSGMPSRFELPAEHVESDRRAALALWLAARENPLTWRSIVNRVWQYHFGRGIVETPNDFGRMGATPTQPELLDWLAVEFRDGGQSLKALHKLMVMSATYRQRSASIDRYTKVDSDNRFLWRMNRRKLEAEAVRDSVLAVAGVLDGNMEGPSFRDFIVEKPEHSPHYEYKLHDPSDPKSHRRSVYRFIVRSQQQPFMTTLDCADPSMQVGKRNESVSPLQALALLNNGLMIEMSRRFGDRLRGQGEDIGRAVSLGYHEAIGRPPEPEMASALTAYAKQHGLANYCRVLFNLNEFSFVD